MKILLTRPNDERVFRMAGRLRESRWLKRFRPKRTEIDLGLLYIASVLDKAGHQTRIADLQVEKNPDLAYTTALQVFRPDIVGITAQTGYVIQSARLAGIAKEMTGALTVVGGHHPSALPDMTLEQFPSFDFAAVGEGEFLMKDLADSVSEGRGFENIHGLAFRDGNSVRLNPPRLPINELDELPFPDRSKVDVNRYLPMLNDYVKLPATNMLSARGCPYNCSFCARTGTRYRRKVRTRSVENVIEELIVCKTDFGISDFWFVDDTFTFSKKRVIDFCERMIRYGIDDNWACYACPGEVNREMLRLMKRAGCFLIKYGVESGVQSELEEMGKKITLEKAAASIELTRKAGIETFASFIVGMPGQTEQDVKKSVEFAINIKPDIASFASLALFPGSPLFDRLNAKGQILHYDWDRYLDTEQRVFEGELSGEILVKLIHQAFKRFYLRPGYILQKFRRLLFGKHRLREIRNILMGFIDMF